MEKRRKLNFNWRLILVQTLANGLALGLTALVLPGIHMLGENLIVELLVSGLIFGVLNAIVRPVLQFLMFRFLFITFGLVLVLINFVLLWLLSLLTPGWFQADSLLAVALAATLVGLFGTVLEVVLGLRPPIIDGNPVTDEKRLPFALPPVLTPALPAQGAPTHRETSPEPVVADSPTSERPS
jgi:putative membrane protein